MPVALHPDISALIKEIQETEAIVNDEKMAKQRIEFSDAYVALNKQEEAIRLQKLAMLEDLPNSEPRLKGLKTTLMAVMENEGREQIGPYRGKFKEKREVNTERVLEILAGDVDHFLRLAKITQIDLKALAREEGGEKKKALEECIEVVERKLIDLEPITPDR